MIKSLEPQFKCAAQESEKFAATIVIDPFAIVGAHTSFERFICHGIFVQSRGHSSGDGAHFAKKFSAGQLHVNVELLPTGLFFVCALIISRTFKVESRRQNQVIHQLVLLNHSIDSQSITRRVVAYLVRWTVHGFCRPLATEPLHQLINGQ